MAGMRQKLDSPDAVVARIAARQHGVVSREQLLGAGLSASGIARRVRAARLHRIYRGVYAVGHPGLSSKGRWMAAVLACPKGAVLSHRSAAELWSLLPARPGRVHVSIPTAAGCTARGGIRLHRRASLPVSDTTRHKNIPVTSPARTIEELRRVASIDDVRRAIREAEFLRLPLGDEAGREDLTRSQLERRFLALCRQHRLPKPEVNVIVGGYEVDCLWSDKRLIVEVDGYGSHGTRTAFEEDRARDVELRLLGFQVLRFTYLTVVYKPERVAAALRRLL